MLRPQAAGAGRNGEVVIEMGAVPAGSPAVGGEGDAATSRPSVAVLTAMLSLMNLIDSFMARR